MALKPKLKNNSNLHKEEALKEVVKEKMVNITILLPESLRDNLKVKAIRNKTNITNVIVNYIKEYIKLISSKPAEEIFKLEEALAAKDNKHDAQKYIKQISMMSIIDSEIDIFESLKKSAKLKNIDENVADHAIKTLKALNDN